MLISLFPRNSDPPLCNSLPYIRHMTDGIGYYQSYGLSVILDPSNDL